MMVLWTLLAAIGLALVHFFAGKLPFLEGAPRSGWLSAAGGVAVAYVFLQLLPDLAEGQRLVEEEVEGAGGLLGFLEHHLYFVALIGLSLFYGLERAAMKPADDKEGEEGRSGGRVFWLHVAAFSLYNGLIGYLIVHRDRPGLESLLLYFVAMALHFVVIDSALRQHHKREYTRLGRWLLSAAILFGWAIGWLTEISELALFVLIAFIAGGIVLNVLKEELPEAQRSRFSAFALGAGIYSAILLAL